mgnify:CR=1 FL=1
MEQKATKILVDKTAAVFCYFFSSNGCTVNVDGMNEETNKTQGTEIRKCSECYNKLKAMNKIQLDIDEDIQQRKDHVTHQEGKFIV